MSTSLQNLENIVKNTEENLKRKINPLPSNAPPILNLPAETSVNSANKNTIINYNIYYDFLNYLNNIFLDFYKANKWAKLAVNTIAAVATNTKPFFVLNSEKSKRDMNYIKRLEKRLKKPNHNDSWYTLLKKIYMSLVNFGNAYLQVIRDYNGELHSLYAVPAITLKPYPYVEPSTGLLRFLYIQVQYVDKYTYKVDRIFRDDEIIHFKMPNHISEFMGMGAFYQLLDEFDIDKEMTQWLKGYFKNTFNAGTIIQQSNADGDAAERNRQILDEQFKGSKDSFGFMLLEGELDVKNDGNKTKDFPFQQLGTVNSNNILICAGVPLSVAGLRNDEGTLNAEVIQSEEQAFLRNTITDYQNVVFSTLDHKLLDQILDSEDVSIQCGINNQFSRHNATELAGALTKIGCTIDEARNILGASNLDDKNIGNQLVISTNNGIIPMNDYFESVKLDAQIKQKTLDNMDIIQDGSGKIITPKKSSDTKQTSVSVSPKGTSLK